MQTVHREVVNKYISELTLRTTVVFILNRRGCMGKRKILKILCVVFSMLFAFSIGATDMVYTWEGTINKALGVDTTQYIGETEGKYISDYLTVKDLLDAKSQLCASVSEEGCVLLKNENNTLPLSQGENISLFGRTSYNFILGTSGGSGSVSAPYDDLRTVLSSVNLSVNEELWNFYSSSTAPTRKASNSKDKYRLGEIDPSTFSNDVRQSYEKYDDAAIVVFGRHFGESADASTDPAYIEDGDGVHYILQLQDVEREIIKEAKECSEKVIVIINSDHVIEIAELQNDPEIDAILQVGGTGVWGLYGVANVLVGNASPSGHLADTYAVSNLSSPAAQNFGDFVYTNFQDTEQGGNDYKNNYTYVVYQEGIYVGYKYYETRYEDTILNQGNATSMVGSTITSTPWNYSNEVVYPFGYGLSYTTFSREITDMTWDNDAKTVTVTVHVKNTGDFAGKEVVQVYCQAPYTEYDKTYNVEKSAVSLVGFDKTGELAPGEEEDVTIEINLEHVASYDYTNTKTYILDYGDYYFAVGNGAHEALNNILTAKGYTMADGMDAEGDVKQTAKYTYEMQNGKEVDDFTCATSSYSGVAITNHLDEGDLNHYMEEQEKITYLSRKDWEGTWTGPLELRANNRMIDILENAAYYSTDPELVGKDMAIEGVDYSNTSTSYTFLDIVGKDYDDPIWEALLSQLSIEDMQDLVCQRYSKPIESIQMPAQREFDGPAGSQGSYITSEAEYRVSATTYMSEVTTANTFNPSLAYAIGEMFGNDCLWTGYNAIWAPGVNTHRTPMTGRNGEYYSEDGILAFYCAKEMSDGAIKYGLSVGPKHFFLNDQETNRAEVNTFVNEQAAREIYLRGFEGAMAAGSAYDCMSGKNNYGCYPVSGFKGLLCDIVQGEWDYRGSIITDSSTERDGLGAYYVLNGLTQFDTDSTAAFAKGGGSFVKEKVVNDRKLFEALKEATHRVLYFWSHTSVAGKLDAETQVITVTPWYQTTMTWVTCVLGFLSVVSFVWLAIIEINKRISKKRREREIIVEDCE